MFNETETDRKLCIICSKGSLDMAYPGLVLGFSALSEGVDVTMFFTFWGLDMIRKNKADTLKVSAVGNPSMALPNGMGIPTMVGGLPGMTAMASTMMRKEITKLHFPPVSEYLQMISDAGGKLYGCQMAMDMMKVNKEDLLDIVDDVIGAGDFIEKSEGAQIIFI